MADPRATIRQLGFVWASLMGGVALYTVVALSLIASGALGPGRLDPSLVRALAVGLLVYMLAGLVLRRAVVARLPADPEERLQRYRIATSIGLALMESGGLVVITLGLLSGSSTWVLTGGASALAMMATARPSLEEARGGRGGPHRNGHGAP